MSTNGSTSQAPKYDVVGIGNAIVDVISNVDENFIHTHDLTKGAMTLIDAERASNLYEMMPPGLESSGGSAANTIAGVASFDRKVSYVGKVRDDQLGEVFAHDIRAAGVHYDLPPATQGPPTARCLIQVTPDAERTLNTFLGVSALLEPDDIDETLMADAEVVFCEGYLWDVESAKQAIRVAMDAAHRAGRIVSLTLSDSFCVERHRQEWLELIDERVDLLFGNEREVATLFEADDFDMNAARLAEIVDIGCITQSERGSTIVNGSDRIVIAPEPVPVAVDTTGAGDLYAAGFLAGFTGGADLGRSGRMASIAAAEAIGHIGARPSVPLTTLV
ncbi:MAG: adenosine kinase [Acidobacteria bacterium]|nr:adenosine kinase [Acidobacteriota bacterium]